MSRINQTLTEMKELNKLKMVLSIQILTMIRNQYKIFKWVKKKFYPNGKKLLKI